MSRAPTLGELQDLQDPHAVVEGHRDHIARPNRPARGVDALAIDANVARARECGGSLASPDDPRMPKPLVDTLAIQFLALLLGVGLELLLEGSKLGKG